MVEVDEALVVGDYGVAEGVSRELQDVTRSGPSPRRQVFQTDAAGSSMSVGG